MFFSFICSFAVFRLGRKMKTTTILNRTEYRIMVKEGRAGIYSELANITAGQSFTLNIDENHTYQDYIFSCSAGTLLVTSDDLADNGVITITWENGKLQMILTPRRAVSKPLSKSSSSRFRFLEWFRRRN